jgi:protein-S-isoprenylcysteine O-methyltransferase Ste14
MVKRHAPQADLFIGATAGVFEEGTTSQRDMSRGGNASLVFRLVIQTSVWLCFMALLLFGPAGTWRWPQGWVFLAIFGLGGVGFSLWLLPRDPALLAARLGPVVQRGQPIWDRVFMLTFVGIWCGWLVLMALDAQRWRTSDMPPALNVAGAGLVIAGFFATLRVFRENSFAAPVVRVQHERGQRVIDTGPYAIVRHPMYASALLYLVGLPLLLGSWYGLLAVPLLVLGMAPRAVFEERLLQRDLPGYAAYMTRVRYRLIPGIW